MFTAPTITYIYIYKHQVVVIVYIYIYICIHTVIHTYMHPVVSSVNTFFFCKRGPLLRVAATAKSLVELDTMIHLAKFTYIYAKGIYAGVN